MKFKAESDLIRVLKQKLINVYNRNHIEIFEEVSLGYGIADIVICDYTESQRKTKPDNITLSRTDANIYNIIKNSGIVSFDILYDTTRSSQKSISTSLKKLINCRYIKQNGDSFIINKTYKLPFRNVFAIEAKLKNWKRALNQAHRYKWFAEYAFVVMDAHYAEPAINNLDLFKRYNVGLATISPDGSLIRYYKPIKQKPYDPIMQMLLSEKLKMIMH